MIYDPWSKEQIRSLRRLEGKLDSGNTRPEAYTFSNAADRFIGWTAAIAVILILVQAVLALVGS